MRTTKDEGEQEEDDDESSEEVDFWGERHQVEANSECDADADDGDVIEEEEEFEMTREQWNEISAWAEKVGL